MSSERAVIYVESGTSLKDSSGIDGRTALSIPHSHHHHPGQMGKKNYVIKIQIGEETIFNPVRIDVSTSSGRGLTLKKKLSGCPCEEETSSSGQSSPRSDMTPPPRMSLNISSGNKFGSETSESDTESDISSEFRPLACQAAQFAMREICEVDTSSPSPPLPKSILKKPNGADDTTSMMSVILPSSMSPSQIKAPMPKPEIHIESNNASTEEEEDGNSILSDTPSQSIITVKEIQQHSENISILEQGQSNGRQNKMDVDENKFHVDEISGIKNMGTMTISTGLTNEVSEESLNNFAGYRDIFARRNGDGGKQILSDKGTIRGVKNRVRDGIATFLQSKDTKTYSEKEQGRVVVYTTSMGVVRATFQRCQKVKQILRNLLVKFDERDCYMNREVQKEIRLRLPHHELLTLPQVFLEGQLLGDADAIEKLNETGELRKLLKPYQSLSVLSTCEKCGGFRMLPCPVCNGSKKSVHRNHFTTEFIALKCMQCDPAGLVRCDICNNVSS